MDLKRYIKDPLYWALLIYVILTTCLGFIYQNGLILFLGWNLILAGFSYFLVDLFRVTRIKKKPIFLSILIFILFILFFPNTIYVMTDFIHLQSYQFFQNYPSTYVYELADWMVLMVITLGALLGAKFGISALERIRTYLFDTMKKHYYIFLCLLFILSSIGIYIGRFIRLNSWEFHRILEIIPLIFERFSFFIGFVFIYFMIHLVSYFVMSSITKSSYNEIESNMEV